MNKGLLALLRNCSAGLMIAVAATGPSAGTEPAVLAPPPVPGPCCVCAEACPASNRLWGSAEYLLWWVEGAPLPVPVITAGPVDALGPGQRPGTLGVPGTRVLEGGADQDFSPLAGGRFTVGSWLGCDRAVGIEANYFFLQEESMTNGVGSSGLPGSAALSIPFFDVSLGRENSTGVAFPRAQNAFGGTADLRFTVRLQGAEANGILPIGGREGMRLELLTGFRYLDLDERLALFTSSVNTPPAPRDVFRTLDQFNASNDFYGGQVGARGEYRQGCWFVNATGKVALGGVQETVHIQGVLATNDFTNLGPVQRFVGGYLALPTNSGRFSRHQFAAVPEINVNLGWQPVEWLRVFGGYTFLYVSSVARPGNQIDRVINATQAPAFFNDPSAVLVGPARPAFPGSDSDFWAQGLSFGLELRY